MLALQRYKSSVAASLTNEFMAGGARPNLEEHKQPINDALGHSGELLKVDEQIIRSIIDHALDEEFPDSKEPDHRSKLDAWLAKRLHFALRIPRRLASDPGFWAFLAIDIGNRYVTHRWWAPGEDRNVRWRFSHQDRLRNGLSRLWWGAELARNGPSYEPVDAVFARVRTAQFALELKYSWYRPATIAFAMVAEGLDGGPRLEDKAQMRPLSVRINSYLSLLNLESIGLEEEQIPRRDSDWWGRKPTLQETLEHDLKGPKDGYADHEQVGELAKWYRELVPGLYGVPPRASANSDVDSRSSPETKSCFDRPTPSGA